MIVSFSGNPLVATQISSLDKEAIAKLEFDAIEGKKIFLNPVKLAFNKWWNQDMVFVSEDKPLNFEELSQNNYLFKIKRSEIIKFIRNQDGSGHFDKEINLKLAKIKENFTKINPVTKNGSIGFVIRFGKIKDNFLENSIANFEEYPFYIIRQIVSEFLLSVQEININSARNFLHIT